MKRATIGISVTDRLRERGRQTMTAQPEGWDWKFATGTECYLPDIFINENGPTIP